MCNYTDTVSLWIDNDQDLYNQVHDLAENAWNNNDDKDIATNELESAIKELITDEYYPEVSGMYADILGDAIYSVDFNEIAENWIDTITEENQ